MDITPTRMKQHAHESASNPSSWPTYHQFPINVAGSAPHTGSVMIRTPDRPRPLVGARHEAPNTRQAKGGPARRGGARRPLAADWWVLRTTGYRKERPDGECRIAGPHRATAADHRRRAGGARQRLRPAPQQADRPPVRAALRPGLARAARRQPERADPHRGAVRGGDHAPGAGPALHPGGGRLSQARPRRRPAAGAGRAPGGPPRAAAVQRRLRLG
jgi:hypothetical protein